jgi:hypothetical protein
MHTVMAFAAEERDLLLDRVLVRTQPDSDQRIVAMLKAIHKTVSIAMMNLETLRIFFPAHGASQSEVFKEFPSSRLHFEPCGCL